MVYNNINVIYFKKIKGILLISKIIKGSPRIIRNPLLYLTYIPYDVLYI